MQVQKRLEKREKNKIRHQYKLKQINNYNDRLRINVSLSEKHGLIQVISHDGLKTLVYVSTQQKWFKETKLKSYNKEGALKLGEQLGSILKKDFSNKEFYFDRGSKLYTGRIEAIADGIRKQGINL